MLQIEGESLFEATMTAMTGTATDSDVLVTMADLIGDATLDLEPVHVPREALGRPVSWVHATEQIDPRPHLRAHELVCTLGSALVRPGTAEQFVAAVAAAGVTAIALGIGEVHLHPPRELVDACRALDVPLVVVPHGVPFLAVNDAVLRRRSELEGEVRRKETALISQLLELAREGASEAELRARASAVWGSRLDGRADGDDADSLVADDGSEPRGPSREFLEQFDSLLEFSRRERARDSVERLAQIGQLIDLVAGGLAHPAAILPEVESRGLDRSQLRVSCWPRGSEGALAAHWPAAIVGVSELGTVMVAGAGPVAALRAPGFVCGYSAVVDLSELRRALSEARSALRLARSRGGVAGPEQLVSLDALLEQHSGEQLMPFIEQLLTPLLESDEDGRGDLVATLTAFIDCDRHLQATAERLFVHVNTVRHRLGRIHELSGRDPFTLEGLVDLRIALWAAERRRAIGHRLIRPLP